MRKKGGRGKEDRKTRSIKIRVKFHVKMFNFLQNEQ
jgi:hypothetical protein